MDFELSNEQRTIREAFARFADERIVPRAAALDEAHVFPRELFGELAQTGLFAMRYPEEVGGSGTGRITFQTTDPHHVTPDLLCQVPFVNPNAWSHVRLDGTTPARIDLTIDMAAEHLAYRVALEPTRTTVEVPSIGLTFMNAHGQLVAEDLSGTEPKPVGFAFGELQGHEVDVAIWVHPELRKQGYGTATLKQARTELAAYFPGSTLIIRTPA